jgi:hypothetical protein
MTDRRKTVSVEETALTPRELARLLHVFAHLIETSQWTEEPPPVRRPRQPRARRSSSTVPIAEERVNAALRKLGVLP